MRIAKIWFFITPMTCVSSIFLFAFGISAMSVFFTNSDAVDMWTILKALETLPNPREFISSCFIVFNKIVETASKIKNVSITEDTNSVLEILIRILNAILGIVRGVIYVVGFLATAVVSFFTFPIYCVFFTLRCCHSMLSVIGIDLPDVFNKDQSLDVLLNAWLSKVGA